MLKLNKKDANGSGSTACFGVPVEDVVSRSKGDIPIVLEHVIQSIEELGMFFLKKEYLFLYI